RAGRGRAGAGRVPHHEEARPLRGGWRRERHAAQAEIRDVSRLLLAGAGALAARALLAGGRTGQRTHFRRTPGSPSGGPALALAASVSSALGTPRSGRARAAGAVLVAGLGAGAVGHYDDVVGGRPEHQAKGLRGHLGALREGRLTSGVAKIVGLGAA